MYKGPVAQAGPADWTNSKGTTVATIQRKQRDIREVTKGQIVQGLKRSQQGLWPLLQKLPNFKQKIGTS